MRCVDRGLFGGTLAPLRRTTRPEARCNQYQPGLWRGSGNFWVQRLHRYDRGRLLPHPEALVRRTRLGGPSFKICTSAHPSAARSCQRVPYKVGLNGEWWHHAGRVVKRLGGRVTRVTTEYLVFQPHRGPAQKLGLGNSSDGLAHFGDRRTRRLFPEGYRTADQLKHWIGRAATRVTYRAGDDFDVLWISRGQQSAANSGSGPSQSSSMVLTNSGMKSSR